MPPLLTCAAFQFLSCSLQVHWTLEADIFLSRACLPFQHLEMKHNQFLDTTSCKRGDEVQYKIKTSHDFCITAEADMNHRLIPTVQREGN